MPTPAHIHPTRRARRITRAIACGTKILHLSHRFHGAGNAQFPASAGHDDEQKEDHLNQTSCAPDSGCAQGWRVGLPNHKDTQADDGNPQPAQRRNRLAQHEISEQRGNAIAYRGCRLDIAVIRPGQNQHIGQEKGKQRATPSQMEPVPKTRRRCAALRGRP
jgi:hypothetical protein